MQDHPRLCGEKLARPDRDTQKEGSPPPMRGKVTCENCKYGGLTDHPRLCGEKYVLVVVIICQLGITPAYAGKRRSPAWRILTTRDHPRLCGEKFRIHSFITCQPGSPPPMRGKVQWLLCKSCGNRITPAYAGKSTFVFLSFAIYLDHPRLCGEKRIESIPMRQRSGSPPPMRGKDDGRGCRSEEVRITPAYAGKSRTAGKSARTDWDHPRLCGEKEMAMVMH